MSRRRVGRLAAFCLLLFMVSACGGSGGTTAIVANEVVLAKSSASYQEVRHIVLRGTNREIGRAIARIGHDYYQAQAMPFSSSYFQEKRNGYIRQHFPVLAERQKGVADYFGWGDSTLRDTSALWYDMQPTGCSALFIPGAVTANGHSLQARNMDFYTVTMYAFLYPERCDINDPKNYDAARCNPGNHLFSRNFIMETYPLDGGYASMVVGSFDLMNGAYDGFNEHGLSISGLVDHNLKNKTVDKTVPLSEIEQQEGLNYLQLARAILEGARTVEEARDLVSGLKVYFPMAGIHFLVGDRHGNSMILEFSEVDLKLVPPVPPAPGKPVIMTNHAVHKFPNIMTFPPIDKDTPPYNSFYRYMRLYDYLKASAFHRYTPDDGLYAMSLVYSFAMDNSEGPSRELPLRTLWSLVIDVDELSLKIKFYTMDDDNLKTPAFSDAYTFKLKK